MFGNIVSGLLGAATLAMSPPAGTTSLDVERTVMLMRHGVRAPLSNPPLPDTTTKQSWPVWPVDRAELTPHGARGVHLVGIFDRRFLAGRPGCPATGTITIIADNDQRSIATGAAWAQGLAPGCGLVVSHLPLNAVDPLFAPIESGSPTFNIDEANRQSGLLTPPLVLLEKQQQNLELLKRLDRILCGASVKECGISSVPTTMRLASGNQEQKLAGALADGAKFAQILTLEYAQGFPLSQVGWGQVSAADIETFGALRSEAYQLTYRIPYLARSFGGPLLGSMHASLLASNETKLAVYFGHDSNIAAVAGLLDLHWKVPGFASDDPTPSGAVGFQLLRAENGNRFVRAIYRSPALNDIRSAAPLAGDATQIIPISACNPTPLECPIEQFSKIVAKALSV